MTLIKIFLKKHTLFTLYTIVFLILVNGVIATSGSKHLISLVTFYLPFFLFYFSFSKILKSIKINLDFKKTLSIASEYRYYLLFSFCIFLILGHLIHLGGSPGVTGWSIKDTIGIVELRKNITSEASSLWNYLSSFNLKAILPFSLLLLLIKKKKVLFTILFIVGVFYAYSLMQKSYILTVLFPILLFLIFNKKIIQSAGLLLTCFVVIITLVYVQNPQMRGGIDNVTEITPPPLAGEAVTDDGTSPYFIRVLLGLKHRILVVPGEMVSCWFDIIPAQRPFLKGNGYTFISKITGETYHDYSKELYPIIRPEYTERGLKGSVNAASFMYEYSNFGKIGLFMAALFLAILFVVIELIFKNSFLIKISLNIFPVFMLSSGALTTALFSGGWGLTILLYYIFANDIEIKNEKNKSLPYN